MKKTEKTGLFAAAAVIASVFAYAPQASAAGKSGLNKQCGIFPHPFGIVRDEVPARFGIEGPYLPPGYAEIPVLHDDCPLMPKGARVIASMLGGKPVRILVAKMLHEGHEIDAFNRFITLHIGDIPPRMQTRPESERFEGIYAYWDKGDYDAVYSVNEDPREAGSYYAELRMIAKKKGAEAEELRKHLAAAEEKKEISGATRRKPLNPDKPVTHHESDI